MNNYISYSMFQTNMKCCIASNAGGALISMIACAVIALSFFVAYRTRIMWNKDLVQTTCEYTSHDVIRAICSHDCKCENSCTPVYFTGSDGMIHVTQTCSYKCDICYNDCWHASCTYRYMVEDTEEYITAQDAQDSEISAQDYLKVKCPIGKRWICYYHATDTSNVVNSLYNTTAWLVGSSIFTAFSGISGMWFLYIIIVTFPFKVDRAKPSNDREMVERRPRNRRTRRTLAPNASLQVIFGQV